MTSISALGNIHNKGLFGDHENKNENKLTKIQEKKNLLIVQIVQYKNSSSLITDINLDNLNLTNEVKKVSQDEMIQPEDLAELVDTILSLPNTASIAELLVNCRLEDTL